MPDQCILPISCERFLVSAQVFHNDISAARLIDGVRGNHREQCLRVSRVHISLRQATSAIPAAAPAAVAVKAGTRERQCIRLGLLEIQEGHIACFELDVKK